MLSHLNNTIHSQWTSYSYSVVEALYVILPHYSTFFRGYMARVVVSFISSADSFKANLELCGVPSKVICGLIVSSCLPPASRPFASRTNLACFLHCMKNIRLPWNCAAQKARWSIGVATLNAICHWSHKLPKRYIVTIVSKIVPPKVVKHANMNRRQRK